MTKSVSRPNPAAAFLAKRGAVAGQRAADTQANAEHYLPQVIQDVLAKPVSYFTNVPADPTGTGVPLHGSVVI